MKVFGPRFAGFLAAFAAATWTGHGRQAAPTASIQEGVLNGIMAQVNSSVITMEDVYRRARRSMEQVARRARTQEEFNREAMKVQRDILEQAIDRRLVMDDYEKGTRKYPETTIDGFIKDNIKREFGDRLTLTKMLRESGRTYDSFRQEEREAFIVYVMNRSKVSSEIMISPRRIEQRYNATQERYRVGDRAKVRMIMVDASRHARGEARTLANAAMARLKAGEEFAKVAAEVSDDARTNKGGDRGWIDAKEKSLRPELQTAVFKLEPGKTSDVLEFDGSCFIVKVEERKPAQVRPLKEVRLEIERELKQEEAERLQKAWYGRMRKKAFIRYF
jgi:parvulin-like peptidyl-prolyl isomerase